jgi:hypothetical protein
MDRSTLQFPAADDARSRWLDLLAMTRALGATVAVVLLAAHQVSTYDPALIIATLAWTSISIGAYASRPGFSTRRRPG